MNANASTLSSRAMLTTIIAIVTLGLLYFVTWNEYDRYLASGDRLAMLQSRKAERMEAQQKLEAIRDEVATPDVRADLVRYAGAFREDELYDHLFEGSRDLKIGSVSLAKGSQLPNGLSFGTVSLNFETPDIPALNRYLEYLTNQNAERRYVIKSVSFPYEPGMSGPFGVGLSLGLYYYE
ncbi:MAG TPA: hypothetical protein PK765_06150 [bacterium]|nr:hypothetical protein [bacterium]